MTRIPVLFFLIAIGLILFLICLSAWGTKESELFGGILLLYLGTIILIRGLPRKETTLYGLRFRGILVGIMGLIMGLITGLKTIQKKGNSPTTQTDNIRKWCCW